MLLLKLDEESRRPKFRQVIDEVRTKIETRVLPPGERLPSTRRLAAQLGLHRSTVAIAYQELWALGFIDLLPCSRPRVRERVEIAKATRRSDKALVDWDELASPACRALYQTHLLFQAEREPEAGPASIDFSRLDMDPRLFPLESFRTCLNRVLKARGSSLMVYGDPAGFPPLREYIAGRLVRHGISVSPAEIFLTGGSQQALDLILRMVASPGKAVAVESPTYNCMVPLLRSYGFEALEIPVRRDGMDLDVLEEKTRASRPVLIYTMPNFQNPTGVSTGQAHRERLLALCERLRVPLLEDGFEEEMKYFGKVVLPVKSMDSHGLVIYCGTFSKVLFPGLRLGWVAAAEDCIERLIAIRRFSELSPSPVLQAAMEEFCQNGFYDRHIQRMHRNFRKRMLTALRSLRRHVSPDLAEWTEPSGGYLLWLKLKPVPGPAQDWKALFASHGVRVSSGGLFYYSESPETHLRLSISTLNEEEIEEGIRRLAAALLHAHRRRHS